MRNQRIIVDEVLKGPLSVETFLTNSDAFLTHAGIDRLASVLETYNTLVEHLEADAIRDYKAAMACRALLDKADQVQFPETWLRSIPRQLAEAPALVKFEYVRRRTAQIENRTPQVTALIMLTDSDTGLVDKCVLTEFTCHQVFEHGSIHLTIDWKSVEATDINIARAIYGNTVGGEEEIASYVEILAAAKIPLGDMSKRLEMLKELTNVSVRKRVAQDAIDPAGSLGSMLGRLFGGSEDTDTGETLDQTWNKLLNEYVFADALAVVRTAQQAFLKDKNNHIVVDLFAETKLWEAQTPETDTQMRGEPAPEMTPNETMAVPTAAATPEEPATTSSETTGPAGIEAEAAQPVTA